MRTLIAALLMLPFYAFAAEISLQERSINYWNTSLGLRAANYSYSEPNVMELSGVKTGFGVETSYYPRGTAISEERMSLDAEYMQGELNYDGSLQYRGQPGKTTPYQTKDVSRFALVKGRYEKKLARLINFQPWVGGGLAFRYLRTMGDDVFGYTRDQTYLYAPFTISLEQNINDVSNLVLAFEYDLFLEGRNKSYVGSGLEFRQSSGSGVGAKVQIERQIYSTWYYSNINYQRWTIDDSDIVENNGSYYMEPENITDQFGIGLGAFF